MGFHHARLALLVLALLACQWYPTAAFMNHQPSNHVLKQTIERVGNLSNLRPFVECRSWPSQRSLTKSPLRWFPKYAAKSGDATAEEDSDDLFFDGKTTIALVGGQSLLIAGSVAVAALIRTPNFGFGPGISFSLAAVSNGILLTAPLGILAAALDLIEDKFPALQDVTKATQRSVLALLGGKFKPLIAFVTSLSLGLVAGFGEELLFRGVLQYELSSRIGQGLAVGLSSIIFGALHAVTPLYAVLASLASVYFGATYLYFGNLAVPIVAHAFYDLAALLFAHWTVSRMTAEEQELLSEWKGPGDV